MQRLWEWFVLCAGGAWSGLCLVAVAPKVACSGGVRLVVENPRRREMDLPRGLTQKSVSGF
jgi:hypothetical protein